jgi:hypothetical protein
MFAHSSDVHAAARRRHDQFIANVRTLLSIPEDDTTFGQHVMKPSQLAQMLNDQLASRLEVHAMLRGPIYRHANGRQLMALSVDEEGNVITEEQFQRECQEITDFSQQKFAELQKEVTACNVAMRELAAAHGLTATDLYAEINRRAGF